MLNRDVLTDLRRSDDASAMFRGDEILVKSSDTEGLPTSMLEAWSVGVPVASLTVDPGGVIERHGLDLANGSEARLACDLRAPAGNAMSRKADKRALALVTRHHDLAVPLDSLPVAMDMPRRRTPRGTSEPPREVAP